MNEETKLGDQSNTLRFEESRLEQACMIFAKRFKSFIDLKLHESRLPENAASEAVELMEKIQELQDKFHAARAERRDDFEYITLPFLSVGPESAESSKPKLIIKVFPAKLTKYGEIRSAFTQMEQMVCLLAMFKSTKSQAPGLLELLKILYLHLQRQILSEGEAPEPLKYDANAALKLLKVIEIRPSQTLMSNYVKSDKGGTAWLKAVNTSVNYTRSMLESEIKGEAETSAIRSGVQENVEGV